MKGQRQRSSTMRRRRSLIPWMMLSSFLASNGGICEAFSVVAQLPFTVTTSTKSISSISEPAVSETQLYQSRHGAEIMLDPTEAKSELHPPPPFAAVSSPLFGVTASQTRTPNRSLRETSAKQHQNQRKSDLTLAELKSRLIHQMATSLVNDFEQIHQNTFSNAGHIESLLDLRANTWKLHKALGDVIPHQNNLQFVWHHAGQAVLDFGLSQDAQGLLNFGNMGGVHSVAA